MPTIHIDILLYIKLIKMDSNYSLREVIDYIRKVSSI